MSVLSVVSGLATAGGKAFEGYGLDQRTAAADLLAQRKQADEEAANRVRNLVALGGIDPNLQGRIAGARANGEVPAHVSEAQQLAPIHTQEAIATATGTAPIHTQEAIDTAAGTAPITEGVHEHERLFDNKNQPPDKPSFVFPTVTGPDGTPVVARGNTKTGEIEPTTIGKPVGSGGGSPGGAQTSVADMQQRFGEIKQHAAKLAAGQGTVTRPMQYREGLEYGIANQSAGGHGVPLKEGLAAGAMDLLHAGGGPGDPTYDDYAALMSSTRMLGDDVAKVFKGRQNEDAVKREIALAELTPGDFKNTQVVAQKMSRLQNVIDLAKATMPRAPGGGVAPSAGTPDHTAMTDEQFAAAWKAGQFRKP